MSDGWHGLPDALGGLTVVFVPCGCYLSLLERWLPGAVEKGGVLLGFQVHSFSSRTNLTNRRNMQMLQGSGFAGGILE